MVAPEYSSLSVTENDRTAGASTDEEVAECTADTSTDEEIQPAPQSSCLHGRRRTIFFGTVLVVGIMALLAFPSRKLALSGAPEEGPSLEKLKGKHPEFVSYAASRVLIDTKNRIQICDPQIVAETCKVLNTDTAEVYGTAADSDLTIVHAVELVENFMITKDSVWDFLTSIGAKNVAEKDHAFAVKCQELCEKTVAAYPWFHVPHYSDVGCFWKPGFAVYPTCDVDVSTKAMSDIHFKDKSDENMAARQFGDNIKGELNQEAAAYQKELFAKGKNSQLMYTKKPVEDVRNAVANMFRIFPVIRAKIQGHSGWSGREPKPGQQSGEVAARAGASGDNSCQWANDQVCDEPTYCTMGTDCNDCNTCPSGSSPSPPAQSFGICRYENDGMCDVPRFCPEGTDHADCGSQTHAETTQSNSCTYANDGMCDEPWICSQGTDCTDCGHELCLSGAATTAPAPVPTPAPAPAVTTAPTYVSNDCRWANDGECDETRWCPLHSDCVDCGTCVSPPTTPPPSPTSNDNSCRWANDGMCDSPMYCLMGTDCSDCGTCAAVVTPAPTSAPAPVPTPPPPLPAGNGDTCQYAKDGECDEPPIANYCYAGTDCTDCSSCGGSAPVAPTSAPQPPTAPPPSGGWKEDVLRVAVTAKAFTTAALRAVEAHQASDIMIRWYGKNDEATRVEVKRVLNGIIGLIGNVDYIYPGDQCSEYTYAYVYPSAPWNKNDQGQFKFFLCNYYMQVNRGEKIETLTHEGSHHMQMLLDDVKYGGGTAYGRTTCKNMANDCRNSGGAYCTAALKNADTLCYFINDVAIEVGGLSTAGRRLPLA
jgi:protease YdgD